MMWGYGGYGFGGGMGIGMLLFWGLIIFAVVTAVWALGGPSKSAGSGPGVRDKTALELLGERYAKGEVGKAEFEQKRNDIKGIDAASGDRDRALRNAHGTEAS